MRRCKSLIAVIRAIAAIVPTAVAQTEFTYQGVLKDAGDPANGSYDFVFRLMSAQVGGMQIGTAQLVNDWTVTDGLFTVQLDFGANRFTGEPRWVQVEVRPGTSTGSYTTLAPRQRVTAAPYAMYAFNTPNNSNLWSANGTHIANTNAGRVGIGSLDPEAPLHVFAGSAGTMTAHASSIAAFERSATGYISILTPAASERGILFGDTTTAAAAGIIYNNPATPNGLQFRTAVNTTRMLITQAGNVGIGITEPIGRLHVVAPSGNAIMGRTTATSGLVAGVFGQTDSDAGIAIFGAATALTGETYGGYFLSDSDIGYGLYASVSAPTGPTVGGKFVTDSDQGTGLLVWATAEIGETYAVVGSAASPFGTGVYGDSLGTGVYGAAYGDSPFFGVLGWVPQQIGYGVYAQGRLGASGTKSFRIDHPDDPTEKYLLHYSTESPEVLNFYRGTVILNDAGEATVEMPAYFARINASPSYQLTAVGAPMPNLHVSREIAEMSLLMGAEAEPGSPAPVCTFHIAGGSPGGKVSWRVEAVRNDRWVRKGGAPVEVAKQPGEIGTYQNPELYGQPVEMGTFAPAMEHSKRRGSKQQSAVQQNSNHEVSKQQ